MNTTYTDRRPDEVIYAEMRYEGLWETNYVNREPTEAQEAEAAAELMATYKKHRIADEDRVAGFEEAR